jgi:PIN domain nuclease of toxin-antitoxin system
LDTNAFLWSLSGPEQLSKKAFRALSNERNALYLSMASIWEIGIKVSLGKLKLDLTVNELVETGIHDLGIRILSIDVAHIEGLVILPFHHRDPFDRLIIAQAKVQGFSILGLDPIFDAYGVRRIW